jgi:thioesterase domain-containing protein
LGGHSLLAVQLVAQLTERLGMNVTLNQIVAHSTIAGLLSAYGSPLRADSESTHFLVFNRDGARPPLVLFPGVFGNILSYRDFPRLLGPQQPVYLAEPLDPDASEKSGRLSIEEMAARYERELVDLGVGAKLVLGGFSFGASLAFELLHRLRRDGHDVPLLISLDGTAPGYPSYLSWGKRAAAHLAHVVKASPAERRTYLSRRMTNLRRRAYRLLGREYELARELAYTSAEIERRNRRLWLLNTTALARYRPTFGEDAALLLFRATENEQPIGASTTDGEYGWRAYLAGAISVVDVPAAHHSLLQGKTRDLIVRVMAQHLSAIASDADGNVTNQKSPIG